LSLAGASSPTLAAVDDVYVKASLEEAGGDLGRGDEQQVNATMP
jgi:hypothetical protein